MDSITVEQQRRTTWHVVAMPYPGRGHINPMMNLCKSLSAKKPDLLITFVVTEEWHGFLGGSVSKLSNVSFATIPNVIPSELVRAKDFPGFIEAVSTRLEAPFEQLLDRLPQPVDVIIADVYLVWVADVGSRRNIPVASLWTMSATMFSTLHHFELLAENCHFPSDFSERVDYIPGVPAMRLADLSSFFGGTGSQVSKRALECVSMVPKTQYLLFTSVYKLESQIIEALRPKFRLPVYSVGPAIPYFELRENTPIMPSYIEWLNSQPKGSVLYVSSMGSYLSVSSTQMEEIAAGVQNSGVRFLWVSRGETATLLLTNGSGGRGLGVPWCDQLRVLCHPSVGGFWTHCGWNSTVEAVYAGVPMIASPIVWDQIPNCRLIVEDWKIGWKVPRGAACETLVTRQEIARLVQSFMDEESREVMEMRKRARELQEICRAAIAKGGSSDTSLDSFIRNISQDQAQ